MSDSLLPDFRVKLYAEYEFETNILNPVLHRVPDIKDNSELFVRACKLIHTTRETAKKVGPSSQHKTAVHVATSVGTIDVSELNSQDLIEQYVLPYLSQLSARKLTPYFDKTQSVQMFGGGYAFLNPAMVTSLVRGKPKDRCYKESYYLEKTKQDVYVSNDCNPKKIIDWITATLV